MTMTQRNLFRLKTPRVARAAIVFWLLALVIVLRPDGGRRNVRERPTAGGATTASGATPRRPNLLILIADDHRGGTLGIDGDPRLATPRLDALARQGVRFDRAYCNSPVCTPSRQSFITGRLPHAVGVTQLATPLPESATTLGDWLGDRGYETAAIGKMHFNSPSRHGFPERIDTPDWLLARGTPARGGRPPRAPGGRSRTPPPSG